jgi:hypothetical protein
MRKSVVSRPKRSIMIIPRNIPGRPPVEASRRPLSARGNKESTGSSSLSKTRKPWAPNR